MQFFRKLFGLPIAQIEATKHSNDDEMDQQAVLVHIDGSSLVGGVEDLDNLAMLEDALQDALSAKGEVDGHDIGSDDAIIYCYGADAEAMFALMKPILAQDPFSRRAKVVLRFGGPESPERQVQLQS